MKVRGYFSLILLWSSALFASELPGEFLVKYSKSVGVTQFSLEEVGKTTFAKARKEILHKTSHFSYHHLGSDLKVSAKSESLSSTDILYLHDAEGKSLGMIIRERYALFPPKYELFDEKNTLVATAYLNWLGTRFTVTDPNNKYEEYATYSRPYFHLIGDYWYVKVKKEKDFNGLLLAMLAVFQTDLEWRNSELEGVK